MPRKGRAIGIVHAWRPQVAQEDRKPNGLEQLALHVPDGDVALALGHPGLGRRGLARLLACPHALAAGTSIPPAAPVSHPGVVANMPVIVKLASVH